jgi:hypothetical protein
MDSILKPTPVEPSSTNIHPIVTTYPCWVSPRTTYGWWAMRSRTTECLSSTSWVIKPLRLRKPCRRLSGWSGVPPWAWFPAASPFCWLFGCCTSYVFARVLTNPCKKFLHPHRRLSGISEVLTTSWWRMGRCGDLSLLRSYMRTCSRSVCAPSPPCLLSRNWNKAVFPCLLEW